MRIGVFGTFDVENFGDLLFPIIAERELQTRLEGIEVIPYSYHRKNTPGWCYDVESLATLHEGGEAALDGILVGGGHLIRFDKAIAPDYGPPDMEIPHPTGYWLAPALAGVASDVPVLWNAPGASDVFPPWARPLLAFVLDRSAYVSVRDSRSADAVRTAGFTGACPIVPDTAFALPQHFPRDALRERMADLLTRLNLNDDYLVIQASPKVRDLAKALWDQGNLPPDIDILVLPISPYGGDDPTHVLNIFPEAKPLREWPSPEEIVGLVASSAGVLSRSLHLSITALAYGLPVLRPAADRYGKFEALQAFDHVYHASSAETRGITGFTDALRADSPPIDPRVDDAQKHLRKHWDRIADVMSQHASNRNLSGTKPFMHANRLLNRLEATFEEQQETKRGAEEALQATRDQLDSLTQSRAWRLACAIRRLAPPGSRRHRWLSKADRAQAIARHEGLRALVRRVRESMSANQAAGERYAAWRTASEPTDEELGEQRTAQEAWPHRPLISILTPVWNCPPDRLRETIASVQAQTYDQWELCVVDGASEDDAVRAAIEEAAEADPRIRYRFLDENRGISGNSNAALAMAQGEYVALLDHDDLLAPDALFELVSALQDDADIDVVYWDEDKLDADGGRRCDPWFKPDFSPELLLSVNYLMHPVLRRSLVEDAGGFDAATDGAQDWDILLRITERTDRVHHVPKVLYHWRKSTGSAAGDADAKPWAKKRKVPVLAAHLERRGLEGVRIEPDAAGRPRIRFRHGGPKVSIVIPTKDHPDVLRPCLESIFTRTLYPDFEVVLVDTGTTDPEALAVINRWKRREHRFRVVHDGGPFNFSAANNLGAREASGDVLVFLNNDIEVQEPDWLDELVQWTRIPDIGCVGAKLVYPDGRVQHAGIIIGMHGHASHVFMGHHDIVGGPFGSVNWYRNYLAVIGACIAIRRDVFDQVDGFDESYMLVFSDVQLGLDVHAAGYRNMYTPYCRLIHHEGATRGSGMPAEDIWLGYERFKDFVRAGDPYYNPNLSYGDAVPTIDPDPAPRLERLHRVCMEYPMAAQRGRGGNV